MTRRCFRNDLDALFMYNYRAPQVVSGAAFPGDSKPLLTRHLIYQYHSKMSFLELLLYNMRHVQEHAAQLNMFLGQNAIDGASDWVSWVKADEGGE